MSEDKAIPKSKIIAVEAADKMTINQAVAKVKHFYALKQNIIKI